MDFNDAAGITNIYTDKKTNEKLSHNEVYDRVIDYLGGPEAIEPYIPFTTAILSKAFEKDPYFNNTSIFAWDKAAGFEHEHGKSEIKFVGSSFRDFIAKHEITWISCSQSVCLLKRAAARLIEKENACICEGSE